VFLLSFVNIKKTDGCRAIRSPTTCRARSLFPQPRRDGTPARDQATLLASADLTKARASRLPFPRGLRRICITMVLAAATCGPIGGAPDRGQGAGGAPVPAATAPAPRGPAAVLVQVASPSTYAISLVFADGRAVGPVTARLRSVPAPAGAPAAMPVFSASDSRVYYLDGDDEVRYLERDGTRGSATRVPGGPRSQAGFAVSPDDRRIAVAVVDLSSSPPTTRLYLEALAGGGHADLPDPAGARVWPVGWHAGELVLAVGSAPTQSVAANPYGTFAGYELLDAATGGRLGTVACDPAGALTPAGTACLAGGAPLAIQDWAGRTRSLGSGLASIVSAAEAPDGGRVAFCCVAGQLQLWDVGDGSVTSLGAADTPDYGWIDATHLVVSDTTDRHPRVLDIATGASLPAAAPPGRVVARVPGGL